MTEPELSVVIPVGPSDNSWRTLLGDLLRCQESLEIIIVATEPAADKEKALLASTGRNKNVKWLISSIGRGRQQNTGARVAGGNFLWFLHADSRVNQSTIDSLKKVLNPDDAALYYFDLRFYDTPGVLVKVNEFGAKLRSNILGLPFGDQGFCISKQLFFALGAFREDIKRGEDHYLIWRAKRERIKLVRVHASIATSARRYSKLGWLRATLSNVALTFRQAVPECFRTIVMHCSGRKNAKLQRS
ncbi:MAG: glycosyl transferase family 2 [Candidatus Dadabacteria bacterium]|nr:MAG: glycosyl transferase family 2 [Candidatus Dadabacteria bacterium]